MLVTGGAGLIGRVLAQRLGDSFALSSLDLREAPALPSIVADLTDLDRLVAAFRGQDTIVHLAADSHERATWESVLPNNIVGAYHVFEAARRAQVRRVVFASSSHATGGYYQVEPWRSVVEGRLFDLPAGYPLVDESCAIRPDGVYGVSKAFGEALGSLYADMHGLSSIHLRIGWIREDDDPGHSAFASAIWLSQRDGAQIIRRAIEADVHHGVYYATSDNAFKVFSIDRARGELGFSPEDAAPVWRDAGAR